MEAGVVAAIVGISVLVVLLIVANIARNVWRLLRGIGTAA